MSGEASKGPIVRGRPRSIHGRKRGGAGGGRSRRGGGGPRPHWGEETGWGQDSCVPFIFIFLFWYLYQKRRRRRTGGCRATSWLRIRYRYMMKILKIILDFSIQVPFGLCTFLNGSPAGNGNKTCLRSASYEYEGRRRRMPWGECSCLYDSAPSAAFILATASR